MVTNNWWLLIQLNTDVYTSFGYDYNYNRMFEFSTAVFLHKDILIFNLIVYNINYTTNDLYTYIHK